MNTAVSSPARVSLPAEYGWGHRKCRFTSRYGSGRPARSRCVVVGLPIQIMVAALRRARSQTACLTYPSDVKPHFRHEVPPIDASEHRPQIFREWARVLSAVNRPQSKSASTGNRQNDAFRHIRKFACAGAGRRRQLSALLMKDNKRGLRGLLGIDFVSENSKASTKDHRLVSLNDFPESIGITLRRRFDQVSVRRLGWQATWCVCSRQPDIEANCKSAGKLNRRRVNRL